MKELIYKTSKNYTENGEKFRMDLEISLADECNNHQNNFYITADIYEKTEWDKYQWVAGGCCHKEIMKQFPTLGKIFIPLHGYNYHGYDHIANIEYFIRDKYNYSKEQVLLSNRITSKEYDVLDKVAQLNNIGYFTYMVSKLGILDRWEKEANIAIKKLEELTGEKWENPYTPEQERFTLDNKAIEYYEKLTEEERKVAVEKIKQDNIKKRKLEYEKRKNNIEHKFKAAIEEAIIDKEGELLLLDFGLNIEHALFHVFSRTIEFNPFSYNKISKERIEEFKNREDVKKFVEKYGITFEEGE